MKEARQPTYITIVNEIRNSILARSYAPGDSLPTENELASRYGTSRVTVRKALDVLCNENLVRSHQGKGYFIQRPDYNSYAMAFDLIKPGLETRFIQFNIVEASDLVASILGIRDEPVVILIQLALYRGTIPVACEDKYLPYRKGTPAIESLIHHSDFPELVDKKLVRYELHCELEIAPGRLDEEHARMLGCQADEPAMEVRRTIKDKTGANMGYGVARLLSGYGPLVAVSGYIKP